MMHKPGRERLEEALSVAIESEDPLVKQAVDHLAVLTHLVHGDRIAQNLREREAAMKLVVRFASADWDVKVTVADTPHSS
jgi:hypothetical protein